MSDTITSQNLFSASFSEIKKRPLFFLFNMLISGAIIFCLNLYVMIVVANGIDKIGSYGYVWPGGQWWQNGFPVQPFIFWSLTGFMISTLLGYWRSAGTKAIVDGALDIPKNLRKLFLESSSMPLAWFLWGIAIGLYFFGGLAALFKLLLFTVFLFVGLSRFGHRLDKFVRSKATPSDATKIVPALFVGLSAACLVSYPIGNFSFPLKIAILFGVVAWMLARSRSLPAGYVHLFLILGLLAFFLGMPEFAFADDTGIVENGGTIDGVIRSPRFNEAMGAGGFASAVGVGGGLLGSPIGSVLGSSASSSAFTA